ncbi:MAG: hypothetical protein Ct9H90mP16_21760 [Candidatus Poseidoniales archaeon]|nr:MAG: hypothetical protein Ct9H90mP16_21760 [Candidatus Poseidoniales archaeon]
MAAYRNAQQKGVQNKGEDMCAKSQTMMRLRLFRPRHKKGLKLGLRRIGTKEGSLIQDMANRSKWKNGAPSPELAKSMSDEIEEVEVEHVGREPCPVEKLRK